MVKRARADGPSPALHGGYLQRRQQLGNQEGPGTSALASYLYGAWCWGKLSPQEVQRIAHAAAQDIDTAQRLGTDTVFPDLKFLSKLGTEGEYAGKMHEQMVGRVDPTIYCSPASFTLPILQGKRAVPTHQTALWPHEMFAHIYHKHRETFNQRIMPSRERLHAWWDAVEHTEQFQSHPIRHRAGYRDWAIPIVMHGDGVPCVGVGKSWGKTFDVWHWTSLIGVGDTTALCFYIYGIFCKLMSKQTGSDTLEKFYLSLRWSLLAWIRGQWPSHDANGKLYAKNTVAGKRAGTPLAEGYFGVVWVWRADLDFIWKHFLLPVRGYNSLAPCFSCPATKKTMRDVGPGAPWLPHVHKANRRVPHVLFQVAELGLTILSVFADYMHCKHIGTDMYFLGGLLHFLCYDVLDGDSPSANMEYLWGLLKQEFRGCQHSHFNNICLSMFTQVRQPHKRSPQLKGRAGELKSMNKAMLSVWTRLMQPDDPTHQQIRLALTASAKMDEVLDDHAPSAGYFTLPTEAAATFREATSVFLCSFRALDIEFKLSKRFNWTIKAHHLGHIALRCSDLNPRCSWNYMPEDYMHKIKILVQSCCRGVKIEALSEKVTIKIAIQLGINMNSSDAWFSRM